MAETPVPFSGPFIDMVESLRMGPVFARGRRDARAGHVRHLTVSSSLVVAQVRGPEETEVRRARIAVRAFGAAAWSRVEDELVSQARYTAALLAGRMPPGVDRVFAAAGLHLLPLSIDEIAMDCTCEQWPMPCAHVAATLYELARHFESDPFLVFTWRGRTRDELLNRLHQLRGAAAVEAYESHLAEPEPPADGSLGEVADFWGEPEGVRPALELSAAPEPVRADALLDQLDLPPPLAEALRPAYRALP